MRSDTSAVSRTGRPHHQIEWEVSVRKCISSFATADNKVIAAGEFVEDGDPVIKGREAFFAGVSDPVQAPKVEAREEGDTMPENTTPNPADEINVPPVVDERAELRKAEEAAEAAEADRDDDDNDDGNARRSNRPVEEATAEPGARRSTSRKASDSK